MHAHDHLIKPGQRTVTTVCGLRVKVGSSVIITAQEHKFSPANRVYDCPGCIAVIEERGKQAPAPDWLPLVEARRDAAKAAAPAPVMILNSEHQRKAAILCDRLVWSGIAFRFEQVGAQFTVTVAESDVKAALEGSHATV